MRNAVSLLAVGFLVSLLAGRAHAEGPRDEARAHFAAGEKRFQAGDYRGAIAEFEFADRLVPSPILTYNVALCHDKLGDARVAVSLYRQYLERRPDAPNRVQVEARIAALSTPQPMDPWAAAPPPTTAPPPAARVPSPPAPEGDGLAPPRAAPPIANTAPQRRDYDEVFGRRVPGRNAEQAPPVGGPPAPPQASEGPGPEPTAPAIPPPPMASRELPGPGQEPIPAPEAPKHDDGAIYTKWWFWAIVGVGTFIAVDVAVHSGSSSTSGRGKPAQPGLVLFHF